MIDTHTHIINLLKAGSDIATKWKDANTARTDVQRRAYVQVDKHLRSFASGASPKNWIVMPGLRGTGKTTLLTQLYHDKKLAGYDKFFISFDQVKLVGGTMIQLIEAIEELLGARIENTVKPLVLMLDEVQYMEDWALALKTVYDRAPRILILCTGSSALLLQKNPDVTRRVDFIKIYPLCFTEYIMIDAAQSARTRNVNIKYPSPGLSENIRYALFESNNADEVHLRLKNQNAAVTAYWKGINAQTRISNYLKYGTLPFTLSIPEETIIWSRINQLMRDVLVQDVTALNEFDATTISSLPRLLFILASSNETSMNAISNALSMNIRTVKAVLDALEKTEIVTGIPPKGSALVKVRKANKYLFTSPAMRAALCIVGSGTTPESRTSLRGSLLEDIVGLYFKRIFSNTSNPSSIEYDTAKGGADFIIMTRGTKSESIAVEVGLKKNNANQVRKTKAEMGCKYGLVISDTSLKLDKSVGAVYVPITHFLLI